MSIASRRRLIPLGILLLASTAGFRGPFDASAQSNGVPAGGVAPTFQGMVATITAHVPDGFYDLPAQMPSRAGALLRSEPLNDVALPAGMHG